MKTLFLATALIVGLTSTTFAAQDADLYLDFVCKNLTRSQAYPVSVKLKKTHPGALADQEENTNYSYQLIVKTIRPIEQEVFVVPAVYPGVMSYEDVVTTFKSSDGKTYLRVYADELDQTTLIENGRKSNLDCNPQEN